MPPPNLGVPEGSPADPSARITVEEHPAAAELDAVVMGLVGFNDRHAGPEGARRLAVLVRDADGALRGGLLGYTHWSWLFVSHLWVDDALRGRGVGRALVRRAEAEAAARGCTNAHLDTFSFQARGFYERLGYTVFGELADYPPGHSRYFLHRRGIGPAAGGGAA